MNPRRRSAGLALVAFATVALSLSCGDSEGTSSGSDGGSPTVSGGAGGASGGASPGGTTSGGTMSGGTTSGGATSGGATSGGATSGGATSGGGGTAGAAGSGGGDGGSPVGGDATGGAAAGAGGAPSGGVPSGGAPSGGVATGAGGAGGDSGTGGSGTAPSPGCGKPAGITSGRASIEVAGKTREYIIAVPDGYDPNQPYRLIFGWHPWGGSAQQIANSGYFGLASVIDDQAILVAPEGQDYQDGGLGWGNADGEDVAFFHAMVDRFGAELCVDLNRIFSTGFSFGAMFSFTLACTADSMTRAIAPMAGNATTSGRCEDGTRPVATMAFIGTDDTLLAGHRQAVQVFVGRNGCTSDTTVVEPSWCDDAGASYEPCTCVAYQGCSDGYPVVECEYTAGHQFAPNAGAALWAFFSQF